MSDSEGERSDSEDSSDSSGSNTSQDDSSSGEEDSGSSSSDSGSSDSEQSSDEDDKKKSRKDKQKKKGNLKLDKKFENMDIHIQIDKHGKVLKTIVNPIKNKENAQYGDAATKIQSAYRSHLHAKVLKLLRKKHSTIGVQTEPKIFDPNDKTKSKKEMIQSAIDILLESDEEEICEKQNEKHCDMSMIPSQIQIDPLYSDPTLFDDRTNQYPGNERYNMDVISDTTDIFNDDNLHDYPTKESTHQIM